MTAKRYKKVEDMMRAMTGKVNARLWWHWRKLRRKLRRKQRKESLRFERKLRGIHDAFMALARE